MRSLPKSQLDCCRILAVATICLTLAACGLNQREQQIADTNAQIQVVYQASEALAGAIGDLPDDAAGSEHFSGVVQAYASYRTAVDQLNVMLRRLGEIIPDLTDHLSESFDIEVNGALERCDSAIAVLEGPAVDDATYLDALTSLCLCVERYAETVTAVSREYSRLAG